VGIGASKYGKLFLMEDYPRGIMPARVDDKGRLRLPAVFQSFLSERAPLIVVYKEGEPLSVYPEETWKHSSSVVVLTDSTGIDGAGRIFFSSQRRLLEVSLSFE
jgi:hypothetical protein